MGVCWKNINIGMGSVGSSDADAGTRGAGTTGRRGQLQGTGDDAGLGRARLEGPYVLSRGYVLALTSHSAQCCE